MAIEYVGGTKAYGTADTYNVSLTALTGGIDTRPRTGDIVVVNSAISSLGAYGTGVSTSGYVNSYLYANETVIDTNTSFSYKVMGVTPDTTVTVYGNSVSGDAKTVTIQVWRGVDNINPIDTPTQTVTVLDGVHVDNAPITPITEGAVVLALMACGTSSTVVLSSSPIGYSNVLFEARYSSQRGFNGMASKFWSGTGVEDPSTWLMSGSNPQWSGAGFTVALRPYVEPIINNALSMCNF